MATRYNERAYIYLGTVTVTTLAIWLRRSHDHLPCSAHPAQVRLCQTSRKRTELCFQRYSGDANGNMGKPPTTTNRTRAFHGCRTPFDKHLRSPTDAKSERKTAGRVTRALRELSDVDLPQ